MFQTGETVALKKVALRKLEDGIPNQALREIKALQEIEDNQYVSVLISIIVLSQHQCYIGYLAKPVFIF